MRPCRLTDEMKTSRVKRFSSAALCLCLSLSPTYSLLFSASLHLSIWLRVYISVPYFTSLYLLTSVVDLVSLLSPSGNCPRTVAHAHVINTRTVQLHSWNSHFHTCNITINQWSTAPSERGVAVQLWTGVRWKGTRSPGPLKRCWTVPSCRLWGARNFSAPTSHASPVTKTTELSWLDGFPDLRGVGSNSGPGRYLPPGISPRGSWPAAGGGRCCLSSRQRHERACTSSAGGAFILCDKFPAPPPLARIGTERPRPPGPEI